MTDAAGRYELQYTRDLKGAKVGQHTVRISRFELALGEPKKDEAEKPKPLPAKYNIQSTLTREVKSGSNTFDFKLESGGS